MPPMLRRAQQPSDRACWHSDRKTEYPYQVTIIRVDHDHRSARLGHTEQLADSGLLLVAIHVIDCMQTDAAVEKVFFEVDIKKTTAEKFAMIADFSFGLLKRRR